MKPLPDKKMDSENASPREPWSQEATRSLTPPDIDYIRSSGRDPEAVAAQVELLRGDRRSAPIIREATVNDGIRQFQTYDPAALDSLHEQAASEGRLSSFIPASGGGTRLFQSLLDAYLKNETGIDQIRSRASHGDSSAADALRVLENIEQFAIWQGLKERGCSPDSVRDILQTLFGEDGLRYHELPKGLIPFHLYPDGVRTAFEEHVHEAAALTADGRKRCRLDFTVAASHRLRFEEEWGRMRPGVERALGVRCEIRFSVQSPATDTVAVAVDGNIRRDASGQILFFPGGHGALLGNLAGTGGDVVLLKNIDNVTSRKHAGEVVQVRRRLCGLLLFVQSRVHEAIRDLREGRDAGEALRLLELEFGRTAPESLTGDEARRDYALAQLDRPLRVCGVVPTPDPAGGRPFWMEVDGLGPVLQLVESAEVDLNDPEKKEQFFRPRHFNPVEIACSLRDVDGRPYALESFADPARALVAKKSLGGVPSLLYEHPGLWNGGMALWNTVFVETPEFAFNPVKTLSDLLSPGHRA